MNRTFVTLGRLALAGCILITAWSAFAPPGAVRPHLFPWDKAEHFSAFFALTACALVAFPKAGLGRIAAGLSAFGAVIELIQALPFVHRDGDVRDWIADTVAIGAVVGVVIAARIRRSLDG